MAALLGDTQYRVSTDLSVMQAMFAAPEDMPASIPLRTVGAYPARGDYVFAVGYPQLRPHEGTTPVDGRQFIEDGLYGAYGRIKNYWPMGLNQSNPSPVLEIEGDWPSGMSGGPVFNEHGEVIAVVSRSLAPDGDLPGTAYAVWLSFVPELSRLLPHLSTQNPGWRKGFGVIQDTWHLACVLRERKEAELIATQFGSTYAVKEILHRIGTHEFMHIDPQTQDF